jgi:hypothetical protein
MFLIKSLNNPFHGVNFYEGADGTDGGFGSDGGYGSGDTGSGDSSGMGGGEGGSSFYNNYSYNVTPAPAVVAPTSSSTSSKTYAADTWAKITRSQWADYENRFVPYEDALMNMTTYGNPGLVDSAITRGTQAPRQGFDSAQRMNEQHQARYGAALTRGYDQTQERQNNVGRSAAIVNEANRIRQELTDRNREIAFGASNQSVAAGAVGGTDR